MRIAVYLKVTDEKKYVAKQRSGITRWLNQNIPKHTKEIYTDEPAGGTPNKRGGYRSLKQAVKNGDIDVVIVHSVSIISASVSSLVHEILDFADKKVGFVSASEKAIDFRESTEGSIQTLGALRDILGAEKTGLRERVQAGIRKAEAEGKKLGRPKRYKDGDVKKILKLRDEQGWSFARIAGKVQVSPSTVQAIYHEAVAARGREER